MAFKRYFQLVLDLRCLRIDLTAKGENLSAASRRFLHIAECNFSDVGLDNIDIDWIFLL